MRPKVVIFVAPKTEAIQAAKDIENRLRDRGWRVLQVVSLGSRADVEALKQCDLVLTLGGDGPILYASRLMERIGKPILGINFGKIGLLTEVGLDEFYESLERIESGNYRVERYRRLVAKNLSSNKTYPSALNEYAVMTRSPGKILGLDIFLDGEHIACVLCDGLVISTPIGSTSYSLSSGGPVVVDWMEAMIIVPIAPLFRSMYPIVAPCETKLRVKIREEWIDAILIGDGIILDGLRRGDELEISYGDLTTSFIRLGGKYSRLRKISGTMLIKVRLR